MEMSRDENERRQADTYSIEAQKRAIQEACARRGWSVPFYYEEKIATDSAAEEKNGDETTESK